MGKKFTSNFGKSVSKDAKRRRQSKSGYGYINLPADIPIFSPEPKSKVRLDVIPYVVTDENHPDRFDDEGLAMPDTLWYRRPFSIHRQIGMNNDTVVCPQSVGASKCPICEYRQKRLREGASYDDEGIQETKPSNRNLYAVIPIASRTYDEIIHIWDMSEYLFQELLDQELEEFPEMGVFPDLEEGKTLRIRFDEGKIGDNTFPEASRIDFIDRDHAYDEDILEDVPNLDKMLQVMSYEQLENKFFEIEGEDYADETIEEDVPEDDFEEPEDDWEDEDDWEEPEEDEWEDEFEEDFEDEFEDEEFDEDFDDEWEEEEEEPEEETKSRRTKRKKKKKSKRKKKPKRKKKKKSKRKRKRKRKS